ncbi:MAG: AAA family ATPase [Kiritimatiellae bacterium]|nr:AAA family ATPase [Kiritimatiellia bacterium]
MYLEHFGLCEPPFNITPDPRFLFLSPSHREAMDAMLYGVSERKGFIEVIGEVGCGKTTLCRAALRRLGPPTQTAMVLNPSISATQLIRAILTDLGVTPAAQRRLDLIEQLNAFLLDRASRNVNVAIVIDEAQTLAPEVMEQVRLLSNLETDERKLMQIVLVGQPELDRRLAEAPLRQLRQRIMVKAELRPLAAADTAAYIAHRLAVAGAPPGVGFEPAAAAVVHERSGGIPRLINKICDRAMLAAYSRGSRTVSDRDVRGAVTELESVL